MISLQKNGLFNDNHHYNNKNKIIYSFNDPNDDFNEKENRTKTMISIKHINNPNKLDMCKYSGCDTVWKNFKRAVWCFGNNPFLGKRGETTTNKLFSFASSLQKDS